MKKAKSLLGFVFVLFSAIAGVCQNPQRATFAVQNNAGYLKVIPNAAVTLCVYNAQLQCNSTVTIYSNSTLTSPIAYPFRANANGYFSYYAASGNYVEQQCIPGAGCFSYQLSLGGGSGGGGGGATLPTNALVFGLSSTTSRAATTSDISTLLSAATNCDMSGYTYSPFSNTCLPSSGSGGGFPITLGTTAIAGNSTTTEVDGLNIGQTTPELGGFTTLNSTVYTNNANNYPADPSPGQLGYNAASFKCGQTLFPFVSGYPLASTCIANPFDNDWSPGFNFGSPGVLGFVGSQLHNTATYNEISYSSGIVDGINFFGQYTGAGDRNILGLNVYVKPAQLDGSGEGVHLGKFSITEVSPFTATINSGSAGQTALSITCTSNCGRQGQNHPLIDVTSAVTDTISSPGTVGTTTCSQTLNIATVTTASSYPVSTIGCLAADVNAGWNIPNNSGHLSSNVITVNINSAVAPTTSTLISVMGPQFYETVIPTAVTTISAGSVYQITATFYQPHPAGTTVCIGGAVGRYIKQNSSSGDYYLNVMCSPSAHTLWAGFQGPNGMFGAAYLAAGAVTIGHGAEVVGVLNPANSTPDGTYLLVEANDTFASGDTVENTNNISANYALWFDVNAVANPYANRVDYTTIDSGLGGAGSKWEWQNFQNGNAFSSFQGAGGQYIAPSLITAQGPVSGGIIEEFAGLISSGSLLNCPLGYFFCAGHLGTGATSNLVGIFDMGDTGDFINYDHSAGKFNFRGNVASTGTGFFAGTVNAVSGLLSMQTPDDAFEMLNTQVTPGAAAKMGLLNVNLTGTDVVFFSGSRAGGPGTATPNVNVWMATLNSTAIVNTGTTTLATSLNGCMFATAGVVSASGSCGSGGSGAWSAITNPTGNLALTMGSDTSTFTFGATTGSADLFKWTDTASNTGTGILGHFTTASGSTEVPFCADVNGLGWCVNVSGFLASEGASASGEADFSGSTSGTIVVVAPAVAGTPTLTLPTATGTLSDTIASGTSALGTGAISSGTCASAVTTAASGTATTDVIWWGFNGDPTGVVGYQPTTNGMLTVIAYPTSGNVNYKVCNNTSASVTPGAITLNWKVVR